MSALYVPDGSAALDWARGVAWLWRLGDPVPTPRPDLVGVGTVADAESLDGLLTSGDLAAAIVLHGKPGPKRAGLPAVALRDGVARFERGGSARGELAAYEDVPGEAEVVVRSSLGAHAVRTGRTLVLAHEPERDWGRLDAFWAFEAAHEWLKERGPAEPHRLPAIGVLRLDDTPAIALHQLQGRAKGDRRQAPRIRRTARRFVRAQSVLNVAVAAEVLDNDRRVPLDRLWPRSVAALHAGVESGAFEPVCHGLLHLDTEALVAGEVEFREFARLDREEAGERLDRALEWQRQQLGDPATFVAPAWAYGEHGDAEAARRGLVRWHRPLPGPLLEEGRLHESLIGALPGLNGLDYTPLQRLAAIGIPPMIAMHGALLDSRTQTLHPGRDPLTLARLLLRRDVTRLIRLDGIRWLAASELVQTLERHASDSREAGVE